MDSNLSTRVSENAGLGIGNVVTQLQDIKEEEDVELTRLQSSANDTSSAEESQMSGSKLGDEKIEYGVTISSSRASSSDGEKPVVGNSSRDDLSLLPPLPHSFERVIEGDASPQKPEQEAETREADGHFDLSKALEIPVSYANNTESSTIDNGGSDSSLTLTPRLTSPKLSLKKKFSNATPVAFPTQREGSPGEIYDSRAHSMRSKSVSNATTFQHILPTLNLALDGTANDHFHHPHHHPHHHHHQYQARSSQDRKSTRKFSFGDSSSDNSCNSFTDAELLYRMPPPSLNRVSNSRSRSNSGVTSFDTLTNPTTAINTPTASLIEGESDSKKVPLLRRASSAILRKASLRGKAETMCSSSASTTPVLQSKPFFESQRTPPSASRYCSSVIESGRYSDDDLQYVTQIDGSGRCSRNPSIGSRVRKGFSRIMSSSGSVRRVTSSASLLDSNATKDMSSSPATDEGTKYEIGGTSSVDDSSRRSSPLESRRLENVSSGTPVSASTFLSPVTSKGLYLADQRAGLVATGVDYTNPSGSDKETSVENSGRSKREAGSPVEASEESNSNDEDINDDVTVDLDKLTQSIPVITVTDNRNSKDGLEGQSNISLDDVYRGKNFKNYRQYIGSTREKDGDSKKPEMMTLREYIEILVKQQRIEDERLALLEKNFKDSGWCSKQEMASLKQKRIVISKKWAERISFYQNKLDL